MTPADPRAQALADVLAAIRAAAQADHCDGYNIPPAATTPATSDAEAIAAWSRRAGDE